MHAKDLLQEEIQRLVEASRAGRLDGPESGLWWGDPVIPVSAAANPGTFCCAPPCAFSLNVEGQEGGTGMDQERRVVVGVNGSMASLAALRWAAREAGLRQARLHVYALLGRSPEVPVDAEVVDGLVAKVLIDRAAGADLLVLGDPATSQLEVIGPVARACLRHAPCPVVVVGADISRPVPA